MTGLKKVLHEVIHQKENGTGSFSVEELADITGLSPSYLYRSALADDGDTATGCRAPLKMLIPYTLGTRDYRLLDYIEARVGRVCVLLPAFTPSAKDMAGLALDSVREFGRVAQEAARALEDGKVTRKEAVAFEDTALGHVRVLLALVQAMKEAAG